MATTQEIVGHKLGHRGRAPKRVTTTRICEVEDCETRLSMYNHKNTCFRHSPTRYPRTRGRAIPNDGTPRQDPVEP